MKALGELRVPVIVALVAALLGVLFVWLIGSPLDDDACAYGSALREGSSVSSEVGFSPPGTWTCEVTAADGAVTSGAFFPGFSYLVVVLLSVALGLLVWVATSPRRSVALKACLGLAMVAGLLILAFISAAASAIAGALILTAAIVASRSPTSRAAPS